MPGIAWVSTNCFTSASPSAALLCTQTEIRTRLGLSPKSSQWKPHALAWGGNCVPFLVEIAGKIWDTSFVFRRGFQPSAPLLASPTPR